MALQLKRVGITRVRPLLGGFDEWVSRGYPIDLGGTGFGENSLSSMLP